MSAHLPTNFGVCRYICWPDEKYIDVQQMWLHIKHFRAFHRFVTADQKGDCL